MLLTKECDYGVRIIRALMDGTLQTVKTICDKEHVPHQYAYKILKKLEKAGLVQSHQGPSGGYRLVKSLSTFTLCDVVTAIDKDLFLFECIRPEWDCPRNDPAVPCTVHQEFCRLQEVVVAELRKKTMEELFSD